MEWSKLEKDVFLTLLQVSGPIIEDKEKDLSTKSVEWQSIQKKFKEMTGKKRNVAELKNKWEEMKIFAKCHLRSGNVSSSEYIKVLAICLGVYNEGGDFDLSKIAPELQIKFEPPKVYFMWNENVGNRLSGEILEGETSGKKRRKIDVEDEGKEEMEKRTAFLEEEFKLKKNVWEKELQHQDFRHKLEVEILVLKKKIMLKRIDLLNQRRHCRSFGENKSAP